MNWYEEEVAELLERRDALTYEPRTIFYGSSTIRLWESLYNDFKDCQPVNLGFGGSTLEACVYFFDRIVAPLKCAQTIVVYAGDNDLGDGREPEEVLVYFKQLADKMNQYLPALQWHYISVKPSIARWNIDDKIRRTNELIQAEINKSINISFFNIYDLMLGENGCPNPAYYDEDGLHLSKAGYAVWRSALSVLCVTAL